MRQDGFTTKLKKNDVVVVTEGKNLGKKGRVLRFVPSKGRVVVEGVNFVKKATRPSQKNPQGGLMQIEASIHISNVMLFCKSCNKGVKAGKKRLEDNTTNRYCRVCGETI